MLRALARPIVAALLTGLFLGSASAGGSGAGQTGQAGIVTMVVPFTPGTGIDILARLASEKLQAALGQTVVVENRPGASGNIGTGSVARAQPDGRTLLMTANTFVITPSLYRQVAYEPAKDFSPVIAMAWGGLVLAVKPSLGANTVAEFIALAKSTPGRIDYASPGVGTPQHLSMELLKQRAGVDLLHVPYKGSAGAVQDLIGGHVSAMIMPIHTALPLAKADKIKLLAVGGRDRSPFLPELPSTAESGIEGVDGNIWYGMFVPAGTAPETIGRLNGALNELLTDPRTVDVLKAQGLIPIGGAPERLRELVATDQPRWAEVVKRAGITAE